MKRQTIWDAFWAWAGRVPLRQKLIGIVVAPLLILGSTMAWWVSNELGGWLSYLLSEERVAQAMTVGMRGVFIITLFAAVAGLGIGWFLTWLLTRPILDITYVARNVENGNLSLRAPVWANDEIGELGRTFNAMIGSLDTSRQQLERSNTQLKDRNQELAVLYELAGMANRPYTVRQSIEHGLQRALENTGAQAGLVLMINEGETSIAAHSSNLSNAFLEKAAVCLLDAMLPQISRQGSDDPLVIDNIDTYSTAPAELILACQRVGYPTQMLVPIMAKNSILGVLVALYNDPEHITAQSKRLVSGICNQLGVTVENSQLWEQLRQKERVRTQLLNKVVTAQEEERQRISRELHDETGQALTSLLVQLKILERFDDPVAMQAHVEDIRQLAVRTLQEVRRLAADLRPAALDDLGLIPALEGYIYEYDRKTGIQIDFQTHQCENVRLPHELEIVLYRVVQESLTNIARHAEAQHVTITIKREHSELTASIEDDGCGFNVDEVLASGEHGLGLLGMQERIELAGGHFSLDSAPGTGTRIRIHLTHPGAAVEMEN